MSFPSCPAPDALGCGKIAPGGQKEPDGESALRNTSLRQDGHLTYRSFKDSVVERLASLYPAEEARAITVRLLTARLNVPDYKIAAEPETTIKPDASAALEADLERLAEGCPLQYVLGFTEFCGLRIRVAPGCLIPRPETEELVSLIVENFGLSGSGTIAPGGQREPDGESALRNSSLRQDPASLAATPAADDTLRNPANILDLCTGSGCIAYALADAFPDAQVFACDLSEAALTIACKQRVKLPGARPVFFQADVLGTPPAGLPKFDLVVSNPPYVRESERAAMRRNVLDYEPHIALFVPDDDPLLFYRSIALHAANALVSGGKIYLEVNSRFANEVADLLRHHGFTDTRVIRDTFNNDRFVTATQP